MLEVLVSVLIFSLGVLGLIGLQTQAMKFSTEAEDRNRASLLANEIASTMWLTNNTVVNTTTGTPSWDARTVSAMGAGATVVVQPVSSRPNTADVTIRWTPPQRDSSESSSSQLITRVTLPPPP